MKSVGLLLVLFVTLVVVDAVRVFDCWRSCGRKGGNCNTCGETKACCRKNYGDPPECNGAAYACANRHCCALKKGQKERFAIETDQLKMMGYYRDQGHVKGGMYISRDHGTMKQNPSPSGMYGPITYTKLTERHKHWQWLGYSDVIFGDQKLKITTSLKFHRSVPEATRNYGIKVYGKIHNDWLDTCKPDIWCDVELTIDNDIVSGDGNHVILIFDTVSQKQVIEIRTFTVEIVYKPGLEPCLSECGGMSGPCDNHCGKGKSCCSSNDDDLTCRGADIPCNGYHCCVNAIQLSSVLDFNVVPDALPKGNTLVGGIQMPYDCSFEGVCNKDFTARSIKNPQRQKFDLKSNQLVVMGKRFITNSVSRSGGQFTKNDDGSFTYKKTSSRKTYNHWMGFRNTMFSSQTLVIKVSLKFHRYVPPRSSNFGVKVYGTIYNEWVEQCAVDQWCDVEVKVERNKRSGDGNHVLLIFDSLIFEGSDQLIDIRKFEIEIVYQAPRFSLKSHHLKLMGYHDYERRRDWKDNTISRYSGQMKKNADGSFTYKKLTSRSRPYQWLGYSGAIFGSQKLVITVSLKFHKTIPPRSRNFGVKVFGQFHNDWMDQCVANEWCDFDVIVEENRKTGDGNHVIMIFDSVSVNSQVVDIRKFEVNIIFKDCEGDSCFMNKWHIGKNTEDVFYRVRDHRSAVGSFSYVEIFKRNGGMAILDNKEALKVGSNCMWFVYYVKRTNGRRGCTAARFEVKLSCPGKEPQSIFTEPKATEHTQWIPVISNFRNDGDCKLSFMVSHPEVGYNEKSCDSSYIVIDDFNVNHKQCDLTIKFATDLECDFEKWLCNWNITEASTIKDIEYHRDDRGTDSLETGPEPRVSSLEATRAMRLRKGYYLAIDASLPNNPGKSLTLVSPEVISLVPQCLRMYINMNGKDEGLLQVDVIRNGQTINLFKVSGNQGPHWFEKSVSLPVEEKYKVFIRMTTGNGLQGDMAIDNIIVEDGACPDGARELAKCEFTPEGVKGTCVAPSMRERCQYSIQDDDGEKALHVELKHCPSDGFWLDVYMPKYILTKRKSCISFDYKMTGPRECRIDLHQKRFKPNETKIRDSFRLSRLDDSGENWWQNFKTDMDFVLADTETVVSLNWKFRHRHCHGISLANVKITEGICPLKKL